MTTTDDAGEPVCQPAAPEAREVGAVGGAQVSNEAGHASVDVEPSDRLLSARPSVYSLRFWRVVREIAIVTVGVLLAFALNAWWTDRAERRQEQVHLHALISDFEWNLGSLSTFVERQERTAQAALDLLKTARSEPGAHADRVQPMMGLVFSSVRFEPVTGAYDALLNSAGLTLVRNPNLRASLATFAARLEDRYEERFADDLYLSFIRDFTGQLRIADVVLDESVSQSFVSLLSNPRFQEHLALRHVAERGVVGQYRRLMGDAQAVLDQLRGELR